MLRVLGAFTLFFLLVSPALSQPMDVVFEGTWMSSTGAIIVIEKTDDVQVVHRTVGTNPFQEAWLNSSRQGVMQITYHSSDGDVLLGEYY